MSNNTNTVFSYTRAICYFLRDSIQTICAVAIVYLAFSQAGFRFGLIAKPLLNALLVYSGILIFALSMLFLLWIKIKKPRRTVYKTPYVEIKVVKGHDGQWVYNKKIVVIAQCNGVNHFIDRFYMTGGLENIVASSTNPNVTVLNTSKIGSRGYIEYRSNRYLRAGESMELNLKMAGYDHRGIMQNYLGTIIKEPTDMLVMSIEIPEVNGHKSGRFIVEDSNAIYKSTIEKGELPFYGNIAYIEFPRPRMGYRYVLHW